jgi:hypothetical protein
MIQILQIFVKNKSVKAVKSVDNNNYNGIIQLLKNVLAYCFFIKTTPIGVKSG